MFYKKVLLFMSITILLVLTACSQGASVDTTLVAEQVMTGVAQTIEAMPSPTPQPTWTQPPTATVTPTATPSAAPSTTAAPTSSATVAVVATQTNICDNAIFVSDITIPDGTQIASGDSFTKTWQVRNTGTCTWDTEYALVFVNGDRMEGKSPTQLERSVAPGESINISINMVAPAEEGSYLGYWQLRNASEETFGQTYYVQITAVPGTPTVTPTSTATTAPETPTNTPTETATETTAP